MANGPGFGRSAGVPPAREREAGETPALRDSKSRGSVPLRKPSLVARMANQLRFVREGGCPNDSPPATVRRHHLAGQYRNIPLITSFRLGSPAPVRCQLEASTGPRASSPSCRVCTTLHRYYYDDPILAKTILTLGVAATGRRDRKCEGRKCLMTNELRTHGTFVSSVVHCGHNSSSDADLPRGFTEEHDLMFQPFPPA